MELFLKRDILKCSFVQCGLVTNDTRLYHNQLRNFIQNRTLVDDIDEVLDQIDDFRAFEREAVDELMEGQEESMEQDEDLTDSDE